MDSNTNSNHYLASLPKEVLPFSEKPFVNRTGFQVPGLTSEAQKLTLDLLQKNHDKFDIFFDPSRGFHSHFVHHILAAYALGGSQELLNTIYEKHASYQRPRAAPKVTITRDNWTEHLGKIDLWSDFLEFFDKVIEEEGVEKVLDNYAFHPRLFPRLFAGFFHPIIHLGYGIEFQIPIIVSEGLAQAAIHQNTFEKLMDEDYLSFKGAAEKKKSAMEIIKEASKDDRFDIIVKETNGKLRKLMAERVDAVKEYSKQWVVPETEEGIRNAIHDLYETCVLAYGTTGIRPDQEKIVLDFFLMHGLTSILLVSAILPYVSVDKRLRLLRAHFAGLLSEYIARGRPELHFDLVKHYNEEKKLSNEPNPWADVLKDSFEEVEDAHLIKVTRALMKAEQEWTPNEKDNIYFKTAQVTCDGFKAVGWGEDIGFEGNWKGRGM